MEVPKTVSRDTIQRVDEQIVERIFRSFAVLQNSFLLLSGSVGKEGERELLKFEGTAEGEVFRQLDGLLPAGFFLLERGGGSPLSGDASSLIV